MDESDNQVYTEDICVAAEEALQRIERAEKTGHQEYVEAAACDARERFASVLEAEDDGTMPDVVAELISTMQRLDREYFR